MLAQAAILTWKVTLMDYLQHFIHEGQEVYVGNHLIADLWGIENHFDTVEILECFGNSCVDAGATVLFKHCHPFGEGCGTTGVIVLSESHASWHHYPEVNMIAIDIFMCGTANPMLALPRIKQFWKPKIIELNDIKRGILDTNKVPAKVAEILERSQI